MTRFLLLARRMIAVLVIAVAAPVVAQDTPPEAAWQAVITSQIEAFRERDATGAFSFAAMGFQETFPSADIFFRAIISSGYAPIMESRSHTFGAFQVVEPGVAQIVKFVGKDQELYEAVYRLTEEPEGWRVEGVALARAPGIGV